MPPPGGVRALSLAERLHPPEPGEVSIVASVTGTEPHLIDSSELDTAEDIVGHEPN